MTNCRRKRPSAEVQKTEQGSATGQPQVQSQDLPALSEDFGKALEIVKRAMTRIAQRGS